MQENCRQSPICDSSNVINPLLPAKKEESVQYFLKFDMFEILVLLCFFLLYACPGLKTSLFWQGLGHLPTPPVLAFGSARLWEALHLVMASQGRRGTVMPQAEVALTAY